MFLNDITQWTSVFGIPHVKASWRFSYICSFVTVKLSSPLKANFKFLWLSNFTLTFFTKKTIQILYISNADRDKVHSRRQFSTLMQL